MSDKFHLIRSYINKTFKTRFEEHNDFIWGEERSSFANHIIEEGHEMKNVDDLMIILHNENNHEKIN